MRWLMVGLVVSLSGCLVSHRAEPFPTAYDHVPTDPTQGREVKACTFELLYFLPLTGPRASGNRRYHHADALVQLQQNGAHAHVIAETITRSWGPFGRSDCTYASGQPVPVEALINPR